jgi:hypothetical protein
MPNWAHLAAADQDLATLGADLFRAQVPEALRRADSFTGYAFIATIRKDGSPRLHPVCPVMAGGRLYVSTVPASPKLHDLRNDARYVLHAFLGAGDAEFSVRGRARKVEEPAVRAALEAAVKGWAPVHEHIFELDIEQADATTWENQGQSNTRPVRRRWKPAGGM